MLSWTVLAAPLTGLAALMSGLAAQLAGLAAQLAGLAAPGGGSHAGHPSETQLIWGGGPSVVDLDLKLKQQTQA